MTAYEIRTEQDILDICKINTIEEMEYSDWKYICEQARCISSEMLRKFSKEVLWDILSESITLGDDIITEFSNKLDWYKVSWEQAYMSLDTIRKFADRLDPDGLIHQGYDEDAITSIFKAD